MRSPPSAENAVTVRTSLLYGTTWPAVIQTDVERAIIGRSTMKFFTDEFRCPAHAADVAAALSALAWRPEIRGPLNIAGPDAVSRAELAATFARWMRLDPRLLKTTTAGSRRDGATGTGDPRLLAGRDATVCAVAASTRRCRSAVSR